MDYNDEYHGAGSMIAYDGELISAGDAILRHKRDKKLREKYEEAEKKVENDQMTWSDVEDMLSTPVTDTRAGRMSSYGPGGPR